MKEFAFQSCPRHTASDIAIDTCRTGVFDLTDPFTLCIDAIAGPDH